MNKQPTIDEAIELIRRTSYHNNVDVTDVVMQRVSRQPILTPRTRPLWQRWTVAASVAVLLSAGVAAFFIGRPSNANIVAAFNDVYSDSYFASSDATICDEMAMATFLFE